MLFDDIIEEDDFLDGDDEVAPASHEDVPKTARTQTAVIGHDAVEKRLLELAASGKFPSALIFNGTVGTGKATMAYRLARYLFKYKNDEEDAGGLFGAADPSFAAPTDSLAVPPSDIVFQQVASGGYPDLLTNERQEDEKGKLKLHDIDEVRKVTQFFRRTSSQGGWRIAIIDDADTMNWHSQNALLKILEEPPKKSLLILISHRIGALLPTILSRAQVITFQPLSNEDLRQIVKGDISRYEEAMQNRIIQMATGSVTRSQLYADSETAATMERALQLLETWPEFDWTAIQHFAESIGGKGTGDAAQTAFRETLLWTMYEIARAKSTGRGHALGAFLAAHSQGQILQICEDLKQHFDRVQFGSLDKRFMVLGAYSLLAGTSQT